MKGLSLGFVMGLEDRKLQELALLASFTTLPVSDSKEMDGIGVTTPPNMFDNLGFDVETKDSPLDGHSPFGSTTYLPTGKYF